MLEGQSFFAVGLFAGVSQLCGTSRDLSMTLTVFFNLGVSGRYSTKLLGLEWCNLVKSQLNVFLLVCSIFSSSLSLTLAQCQPTIENSFVGLGPPFWHVTELY